MSTSLAFKDSLWTPIERSGALRTDTFLSSETLARTYHAKPLPSPSTKTESSGNAEPERFRWSPQELLTPSIVIAEWHGQVVSINENHFIAEPKGTIGEGVAGVAEEAQIPNDEIRDDDRPLVRPGAFFRLCVNLEVRKGTRRRFTDIVFRRMPAYRREELEAAHQEALELVRGLRLE